MTTFTDGKSYYYAVINHFRYEVKQVTGLEETILSHHKSNELAQNELAKLAKQNGWIQVNN